MKVLLRIRDLRTGIVDDQELESLEKARGWLVDRPRFEQVLGVPTEGLPKEINQELKKLCRPLDPEEQTASDALDAKDEAARAAKRAEAEREKQIEREQMALEMKTADPKRSMKVRWSFDGGFANVGDDRAVTEPAKEAVLAWVRERDEWVEGRGQIVGEATLQVWPEDVPAGDERIAPGGTFFPVTKPA